MSFSKKDLAVGTIIGLIVGVVAGSFVAPAGVDTTELEKGVNELEEQVKTLTIAINQKNSQISNLQSQVRELQLHIEELEKIVPPLRSLAEAHGILIGAAVDAEKLKRDAQYAETLSREFNILTPENAMKFDSVHPSRNEYDFSEPDAIVSFARANDMKVRGHTLVWHEALPSWIREGDFTPEEWRDILREHILTEAKHYKGQIYAWDVVNEAVEEDGSLRDTVWLQGIGPEYLDLAFRWAHEADPEALLFYNDYGAEGLGSKSDAVYNLVKGLLERGVPIHGVGLQMHVSLEEPPNPQDVAANIKRLNDLGLEVHITEMDVRIREPATEEKLA